MVNSDDLQSTVEEIQETMTAAEEQLLEAQRQQPGDPEAFTKAQQQLEAANLELEKMIHSADREQRDQLQRLQQRVQQLQNRMILGM
ncbi:Protein of unknown function [Evansella caseinilytica]|uniref:Uncharacterized protein n=1 Tax=Evansella caseinilytica TaxID=1503961 RepID=A0A1H3NJF3_9BACI|nr:DUF2524 family protein [Evansella caseinilytica]SDY88873.1 Protein of unknown function [Evansella caseinilytica]